MQWGKSSSTNFVSPERTTTIPTCAARLEAAGPQHREEETSQKASSVQRVYVSLEQNSGDTGRAGVSWGMQAHWANAYVR